MESKSLRTTVVVALALVAAVLVFLGVRKSIKPMTVYRAAMFGMKGRLRCLLWLRPDLAGAHVPKTAGCTPLHAAARADAETLRLVLSCDPDADVQDGKGRTAPHAARARAVG